MAPAQLIGQRRAPPPSAAPRRPRALSRLPTPLAPPHPRAPCPSLRSYSLAPLIDDCKLLGILLDDCLKADVGTELFNQVRPRGLT